MVRAASLVHPAWLAMLAKRMTSTCTIQAPSSAVTGMGAPNPTWSDVTGQTGMDCVIVEETGGEQHDSVATTHSGRYRVVLDRVVTVDPKNRAVVDGVPYDVTFCASPIGAVTVLTVEKVRT
jgi:hypothetical protein